MARARTGCRLGDLREEEPVVVDSKILSEITSTVNAACFDGDDAAPPADAAQLPDTALYDVLTGFSDARGPQGNNRRIMGGA